jgi:Protein of unknown function (DUF3016)
MQILILLFSLLFSAVSVGSACTDVTTASGPATGIAVVFVQPQHFTDVRYSKAEPNSAALLNELHTFMCKMGERYIPAGMQLKMKVTNIDLAGDFEPWRGPQFGAVRITREIYPPRISLEFRLIDGSGNVVSAGKREISDMAYQARLVRPPDDYLRYEKDILRDWFHTEFSGQGREALKNPSSTSGSHLENAILQSMGPS